MTSKMDPKIIKDQTSVNIENDALVYTRAPFSHSWDVQNGVQSGSRIGKSKNLSFLMFEGPKIAPGCPKAPKTISQEVQTEVQNLSKIDQSPPRGHS